MRRRVRSVDVLGDDTDIGVGVLAQFVDHRDQVVRHSADSAAGAGVQQHSSGVHRIVGFVDQVQGVTCGDLGFCPVDVADGACEEQRRESAFDQPQPRAVRCGASSNTSV